MDYANERGTVLLLFGGNMRTSSERGRAPQHPTGRLARDLHPLEFCSFSKTAGFTGDAVQPPNLP